MTIFGVPSGVQFYKKFSFNVEIQGVRFARFRSMSDLRIQVAEVTHFEGGALIPSKQPGRVTIPDVTLTRGATDDLDLFNWMQEVVADGSILVDPGQKRTLDLVQRRRTGLEVRRWTLHGCWPKEFMAGSWDNEVDENVIEEVVLAMDFFTLGGDGGGT